MDKVKNMDVDFRILKYFKCRFKIDLEATFKTPTFGSPGHSSHP